jgi:hypothetical protein
MRSLHMRTKRQGTRISTIVLVNARHYIFSSPVLICHNVWLALQFLLWRSAFTVQFLTCRNRLYKSNLTWYTVHTIDCFAFAKAFWAREVVDSSISSATNGSLLDQTGRQWQKFLLPRWPCYHPVTYRLMKCKKRRLEGVEHGIVATWSLTAQRDEDTRNGGRNPGKQNECTRTRYLTNAPAIGDRRSTANWDLNSTCLTVTCDRYEGARFYWVVTKNPGFLRASHAALQQFSNNNSEIDLYFSTLRI